jgi:hypothetical protein
MPSRLEPLDALGVVGERLGSFRTDVRDGLVLGVLRPAGLADESARDADRAERPDGNRRERVGGDDDCLLGDRDARENREQTPPEAERTRVGRSSFPICTST